MVGYNDSGVIYIDTSESREPKRFVRCWNKVEKIYSKITTKSVPLLQPEHGFCQHNGSDVAKYLYPNEKKVVVPACLNGRCCSSGYVGILSY